MDSSDYLSGIFDTVDRGIATYDNYKAAVDKRTAEAQTSKPPTVAQQLTNGGSAVNSETVLLIVGAVAAVGLVVYLARK